MVNVILVIVTFIVFLLKFEGIIIYDYYYNALFIVFLTFIGAIFYFKSFSKYLNALIGIFVISFFSMSINLFLQSNIDNIIPFYTLILGLLITIPITILLLEGNIFKDYKKIINIFFGYILTMIFIGHLFLYFGFNGGIYPKDEELLKTICDKEICIDIYQGTFKYKYLNLYYYNSNNKIIKYIGKKPNIGVWNYYDNEKVNEIKNLLNSFNFYNNDGIYILDYKNLKGETNKLIINN
ncbi:MAG: hypothetical protein PHH98_05110 [Candidatus Gracilibacteria bacterium]|nr:hypothetical protein [Candidatus Gracilibacteria bacterium]